MWAHVSAWLADPTDATPLQSFRAACRLTTRSFDMAVHAGWVALSAHVTEVPDDEGATCRWLGGWVPVAISPEGLRSREGVTVRLEHRLVVRSHRLPLTWQATDVIARRCNLLPTQLS
jgi:hypothetical protein